jgi:AhpD family alkylhydroperoxidase
MTPRLNPLKASPESYQAVSALEKHVRATVDKMLLHLLKLRASQINRCAFCIDMHVKEALDDGEDPQRLHLLPAWRETPIYSEKERALLAWTEALTLLPDAGAPDEVFEGMKAHFTDAQIVELTVAVGMINLWNRWAVGFRSAHPVGMDKRVR